MRVVRIMLIAGCTIAWMALVDVGLMAMNQPSTLSVVLGLLSVIGGTLLFVFLIRHLLNKLFFPETGGSE